MAYRLKTGRAIDRELRRLVDKQLRLAIAHMQSVGDPKSNDAIHEARRNVKKIRALIRLVQAALGGVYRPTNQRLRTVSRMLAPVADGEAVVDTLARLGRKYRKELSRHTLASIRAGLVSREARVGQKARVDRVPRAAARLLGAEQKRVETWKLDVRGFRAIAPGLRNTVRGARRAMALAFAHPTGENYHSWRRRVKDHWFQVRLIQERCGNALLAYQRRLEVLDGFLGEHHNCTLLKQVLVDDALVPRHEMAHCLRLLRRYQTELRREAWAFGTEIYDEKPREFVKKVKRLWKSRAAGKRTREAKERRGPWPRAA